MQSGNTPRQVTRLHTSGSGAALCRSWSSSPQLTQRMPSDRLMRAVLSTMDAWLDALDEIHTHAIPTNKARVLHLKRNMLQSKISFIRLVGGTQEEIEAAHAQANRAAEWPDK